MASSGTPVIGYPVSVEYLMYLIIDLCGPFHCA